jgi:hypothetical protein
MQVLLFKSLQKINNKHELLQADARQIARMLGAVMRACWEQSCHAYWERSCAHAGSSRATHTGSGHARMLGAVVPNSLMSLPQAHLAIFARRNQLQRRERCTLGVHIETIAHGVQATIKMYKNT